MSIFCKCGWKHEGCESQLQAEVIADRHESANIRRAYRHDTLIVQEAK